MYIKLQGKNTIAHSRNLKTMRGVIYIYYSYRRRYDPGKKYGADQHDHR